jgi:hypothetical protein
MGLPMFRCKDMTVTCSCAGTRNFGIALMSMRIGGASSSPATDCTGFPKRYAFASLNASNAMRGSECRSHLFHFFSADRRGAFRE